MAPEQFKSEKQAVESLIREAFREVTRDGGISWSESVVVDNYYGRHELDQARARAEDTELSWEDLVDDPSWHHQPGVGGFNFVDPIGFRYYIAPAMIRCIREDGGEFISYALEIEGDFKPGRISLINPHQAHAIARFIRLMIAIKAAVGDDIYGEPWAHAYEIYWRNWDRGP